jgi:hypothetical protein
MFSPQKISKEQRLKRITTATDREVKKEVEKEEKAKEDDLNTRMANAMLRSGADDANYRKNFNPIIETYPDLDSDSDSDSDSETKPDSVSETKFINDIIHKYSNKIADKKKAEKAEKNAKYELKSSAQRIGNSWNSRVGSLNKRPRKTRGGSQKKIKNHNKSKLNKSKRNKSKRNKY